MLGHTKKHLINSTSVYPDLIQPKDFIPWRESSRDRIARYTEAGIILRGSRYKKGMTQKQLAEELGIRQHHISEMENGKRPIGKAMAKKLAEVMEIDYRIFL